MAARRPAQANEQMQPARIAPRIFGGVFLIAIAAPVGAEQPPIPESAVVRVMATVESAEGVRYATGSGFFVNDTHIVTNEHVVSSSGSSSELFVVFSGRDTPEPVELIWSNPDLDLAVLAYSGSIPHAALALVTADPTRGAEVFALGYPGPADTGSLGPASSSTLTEGIVSKPPFQARWGHAGTAVARVLQHTAAINPGNSGGPLVNGCGAAVGVNTSGAYSEVQDEDGNVIGTAVAQGIFFALAVSELSAELRRHGVDFALAAAMRTGEPDPRGGDVRLERARVAAAPSGGDRSDRCALRLRSPDAPAAARPGWPGGCSGPSGACRGRGSGCSDTCRGRIAGSERRASRPAFAPFRHHPLRRAIRRARPRARRDRTRQRSPRNQHWP